MQVPCAEAYLGQDVMDIGNKAACVSQGVFLCDTCADKPCICLVVCCCSQICRGKHLQCTQSILISSCRDHPEKRLEIGQKHTFFCPILTSSRYTDHPWSVNVNSSTFMLPSLPTWAGGTSTKGTQESWQTNLMQTTLKMILTTCGASGTAANTWSGQHHGCSGAIYSIGRRCLLCPSPAKESCALPDAKNGADSKVCIHYAAAIQWIKSHLPQGHRAFYLVYYSAHSLPSLRLTTWDG